MLRSVKIISGKKMLYRKKDGFIKLNFFSHAKCLVFKLAEKHVGISLIIYDSFFLLQYSLFEMSLQAKLVFCSALPSA